MTTCATCKHWVLLNRVDRDARAMAKQSLVNCEHDKPWVFYPPQSTCPRYARASEKAIAARVKWLEGKTDAR